MSLIFFDILVKTDIFILIREWYPIRNIGFFLIKTNINYTITSLTIFKYYKIFMVDYCVGESFDITN